MGFWSRRGADPAPALCRIAAEAAAPSRASADARCAELRAQRHQRALLDIMEGVIRDGIPATDKGRSSDA